MTLPEIITRLGLDKPGQRVLIVEDNLDWLNRLTQFLEEAGHEVTAVAGVAEIEGDIARGPGADTQTTVEFSIRDFDVAFLDHYIMSQRYTGALLARELSMRGMIRIFGMSSVDAANAAMREQGAMATMRKSEFMRLVR